MEDSAIELKFAAQPNWFTNYGVYLKQKKLAAQGFPMCEGWMMVTLTVDQDSFDSPEAAYDFLLDSKNQGRNNRVSKYMREVAHKLHKWGYFEEAKHCVNWRKLEFQSNGWPHWHIFTNLTKRITKDQLCDLCRMWSYGRIRYDKLDYNAHYAFKYAFKCPFKKVAFDPDGNMTVEEHKMQSAVPDWFADKYQVLHGRPFTYDRARFFQRSAGFMKNYIAWLEATGQKTKNYKVIVPLRPKSPTSSMRPITVRDRLSVHLSKVQLIARDQNGGYVKSHTVQLNQPFHTFTASTLIPKISNGTGVSVRPHHYTLDVLDDAQLPPITKYKYKKLCKKNKMSLPRAKRIQSILLTSQSAEQRSSGKLYLSKTGKIGVITRSRTNLSLERAEQLCSPME